MRILRSTLKKKTQKSAFNQFVTYELINARDVRNNVPLRDDQPTMSTY